MYGNGYVLSYAYIHIASSLLDVVSLWHQRLTHPFNVIFQRLAKDSLLDSINTMPNKIVCKMFSLAKAHKIPFVCFSSPFGFHLYGSFDLTCCNHN